MIQTSSFLEAIPFSASDNPFRTRRIESIPFTDDHCDRETVLSRYYRNHRRGALVGPRGSGKTTLLEELAAALDDPAPIWITLTTGHRAPERAAWQALRRPGHTVFLDGAEQLSPLHRLRFLLAVRRAAGILVTAHQPLLHLPVIHYHTTTPTLLITCIERLTDSATAAILKPSAVSLFHRFAGNIRSCLLALYDIFAGTEKIPVETSPVP